MIVARDHEVPYGTSRKIMQLKYFSCIAGVAEAIEIVYRGIKAEDDASSRSNSGGFWIPRMNVIIQRRLFAIRLMFSIAHLSGRHRKSPELHGVKLPVTIVSLSSQ